MKINSCQITCVYLFLNEKDGAWEVWRGEDLCSARLVRVFGTHAEALAFYEAVDLLPQGCDAQKSFDGPARWIPADGMIQHGETEYERQTRQIRRCAAGLGTAASASEKCSGAIQPFAAGD